MVTVIGRLCVAMGHAEMAADPRFADHASRGAHADELDEPIETWTRGLSFDDALRVLSERGVPSCRIYSAADMLTDPHYLARAMILRPHADGVEYGPMAGIVPKFIRTPVGVAAVSPVLGAHTLAMLTELADVDEQQCASGRSGPGGAAQRQPHPGTRGAAPARQRKARDVPAEPRGAGGRLVEGRARRDLRAAGLAGELWRPPRCRPDQRRPPGQAARAGPSDGGPGRRQAAPAGLPSDRPGQQRVPRGRATGGGQRALCRGALLARARPGRPADLRSLHARGAAAQPRAPRRVHRRSGDARRACGPSR
jgi:hypothetical protein